MLTHIKMKTKHKVTDYYHTLVFPEQVTSNSIKKMSSTQDSQELSVFYNITDWLLLSSHSFGPFQLPSAITFRETKSFSSGVSHDITEPCLSTACIITVGQELVFIVCWRRVELTEVLRR